MLTPRAKQRWRIPTHCLVEHVEERRYLAVLVHRHRPDVPADMRQPSHPVMLHPCNYTLLHAGGTFAHDIDDMALLHRIPPEPRFTRAHTQCYIKGDETLPAAGGAVDERLATLGQMPGYQPTLRRQA